MCAAQNRVKRTHVKSLLRVAKNIGQPRVRAAQNDACAALAFDKKRHIVFERIGNFFTVRRFFPHIL